MNDRIHQEKTNETSAVKTDPVLSCRNLNRYLGKGENRVHVLRGISLEVAPCLAYAVEGPSGCGKSTLLYSLGLLDRPDSGEIRVRGRELSCAGDDVRTRARNDEIGFVFQFHFLLPEFTAAENVMLPMYRKGEWSVEEMRERAASLLGDVGLGEKANRLATHLSGGEQQRVAVARALANGPSVILADEPTGNLDATNARTVIELLTKIARERGRGMVIVTHNREIAERCDLRVSMLDGRVADS